MLASGLDRGEEPLAARGRRRPWKPAPRVLLEANCRDVAAAPGYGLNAAAIDRLTLTPGAASRPPPEGLRQVAALPDPVGEVREGGVRPNGLQVLKVGVPLGVMFFIYESRPNVTVDAAGLCVKSGNAVILRGGKEAIHSNTRAAPHPRRRTGARAACRPTPCNSSTTTDRAAVGHFLELPRAASTSPSPAAAKSLIRRVVAPKRRCRCSSTSTATATSTSIAAADLDMAERIVVNAKCQRPGVCNAAESLLVHAEVADAFLPRIGAALADQRRRDPRLRRDPQARPGREARDRRRLRRRVPRPDHLGEGRRLARRGDRAHQPLRLAAHRRDRHRATWPRPAEFTRRVDSRGGDGQRQHAVQRRLRVRPRRRDRHQHRQVSRPRPCGLRELTTYKYVVTGDGQIR